MADDFEKAVLLSFDPTGSVDPLIKEQAAAFCNNIKAKDGCVGLCVDRFASSQHLEVKFWCLQTLLEVVETCYGSLGADQQEKFRQTLMGWITGNEVAGQAPVVRNKLAQLVTAVVKLDFPLSWSTFFQDLLSVVQKGPAMVDMFCRIMKSIDSDVITLDIHRNADESRQSMVLKDALRDTCIKQIVDAWYRLASMYHSQQPEIAAEVLNTVQRYVGWMDIELVANDRFIPLLFNMLGSPSAVLQESAVECLTEILHKRMDRTAKLRLIENLRLLPSLSAWSAGLPGSEEDDLTNKCAKLLATLCSEILDCWKEFENKFISFKAMNMGVSKSALHEMMNACSICEQMIDQLFPAVAEVLKLDTSIAMTVLPFLSSYLVRLKNQQKRRPPLPDKAVGQLRLILEGLFCCCRYPPDGSYAHGAFTSEVERTAAMEKQEAVPADRKDLLTLFKNIARISASEGVQFVSERLLSVLGDPKSSFEDVEVVITFLFELGEACGDECQKPACGALGPLVALVMDSNIPHGNHQLVAIVVLEVFVRYYKVMSSHQQSLAAVVATFVDGRGLQHPVAAVSNRACYLFMRFAKLLKSNLRVLTMGILNGLQSFLLRAAQTPRVDLSLINGSQTIVGTDERMYVFEAAGMLLGMEDVPEEDQKRITVTMLLPLKTQIESNLGVYNQQSLFLVQQALEGISRLSKGFKQALLTEHRPAVGELFKQCLELGLRVPLAFQQSKFLRARFISFLHRMVEALGPQTLPYLPTALEALLHPHCDIGDTIEVVAVVNQLMNRFTTSLQSLMERVLPVLIAEIHSRLGSDWDWSGNRCAPSRRTVVEECSIAVNEENREKGELQRTFYSMLHVTMASKLEGVLLGLPQEKLEMSLSALVKGAATHVDASIRKTCLQVLQGAIEKWGDQVSAEQGLKWFVMEKIGGEICIQGTFQGGIDPKDAVSVAYLGEVGCTLKLVLDRCGYDFLLHLSNSVFPKCSFPADFQSELVRRIQGGDPKDMKNFFRSVLTKLSQ